MNARKKQRYADRFMGTTPSDEQQLEDRQRKVLKLFQQTLEKFDQIASQYKCERILDVGCGDGNFSVLLEDACTAKEVY